MFSLKRISKITLMAFCLVLTGLFSNSAFASGGEYIITDSLQLG